MMRIFSDIVCNKRNNNDKKINNFHIRHYNTIIDEWKCNNEREMKNYSKTVNMHGHTMDCIGIVGKGKIERPCYDVFIKALYFDNSSICLFLNLTYSVVDQAELLTQRICIHSKSDQ